MNSFADYKPHLEIDIPELIFECLNTDEVKDAIIIINQDEQLKKGIDSLEQRIETIASQEENSGYPYSRFTVSERSQKGLQVQNVDLKDTGDFYNSFDVKVTKENTEVLADFDKPDGNILDNFDSKFEFLGLTKRNLENLVTWNILDILEQKVKSFFKIG